MVSAKTIARAQGVCRLMSGGDVEFQGHCLSQQKVNAGNTVLVIKLDHQHGVASIDLLLTQAVTLKFDITATHQSAHALSTSNGFSRDHCRAR